MSRALLRLGFSLAVLPDYASRIRAALLALAVAAVTVVGLAAAVAPQVAERQQQRVDGRATSPSSETAATALALDTATDFGIRTLWNGYQVSRLYIAPLNPEAPVPPGLQRAPGPDEAFVSPALVDLAQRDPVVAALLDGFDVVGEIDEAGLVDPSELRAVVGLSPDNAGRLYPIDGFGRTPSQDRDEGPVAGIVAGFLVLLIGVPAMVLLALGARLSAERRIDRASCLRLLGLSATQVRGVMATEAALIALPAALIGVATFLLLRQTVHRLPGTPWGFFTADTSLPILWLIGVPAVVTLAAVGSAAWLVRDRTGSVRPRAVHRSPKAWTLLAGTLSVAAFLLLARFREVVPWVAPGIALVIALVGLAWGAVLVGPKLLGVLSARLLRLASRASSVVGLRNLVVSAGSTTRLAAVLSVAIVAIGGTLPFLAILDSGSESEIDALVARSEGVLLIVELAEPPSSLSVVRDWPEVRSAYDIVSAVSADRREVPGVVATCGQLQAMISEPLRNCSGDIQWLSSSGATISELDLPRSDTLQFGTAAAIAVPDAADVVTAPGLPDSFEGYLVVPERFAGSTTEREAQGALLDVVPTDVTRVMALLDARAPGVSIRSGDFGYADPDQSEYRDEVHALLVGFAICVMIGALALTMSALGEATARRSRLLGLLRLGAPRSEIVRAHLLMSGLPIAFLGLMATLIATVMLGIMRATDDRVDVPLGWYLASGLGSILVGLVVSAITLPPLLAPLRPSELADRA